jgi:hypothetical protein
MFHGVYLLNADPLGAGILLATNYIGSVNGFERGITLRGGID